MGRKLARRRNPTKGKVCWCEKKEQKKYHAGLGKRWKARGMVV
jgi:hypothetical protein